MGGVQGGGVSDSMSAKRDYCDTVWVSSLGGFQNPCWPFTSNTEQNLDQTEVLAVSVTSATVTQQLFSANVQYELSLL